MQAKAARTGEILLTCPARLKEQEQEDAILGGTLSRGE